MKYKSVTASRCCITARYFLLNTPGKIQTQFNNVAEQAEVDEDDDSEDNCSFGVESV